MFKGIFMQAFNVRISSFISQSLVADWLMRQEANANTEKVQVFAAIADWFKQLIDMFVGTTYYHVTT